MGDNRMKKIAAFILTLCMALPLTACGDKVEITMQEIYEASNLGALIEKHENVYVRYAESGNVYEEQYLSKEYSYSFMDGEVYGMDSDLMFFTTDDAFYSYSDGKYIRSIIISPDGMTDRYNPLDDARYVFEEDGLKETIKSVEIKDGQIIVTSFESQESLEASGNVGLLSYNAKYVLDAKTRELISTAADFEYDDGSVYNVVMDFIYDGEIPEEMKTFVEYDQQTEDLRTVTVVSNPNTENEKSESVQVPKGVSVYFEPDMVFDFDYAVSSEADIEGVFDLYADAACTQPFEFPEGDDTDFTVYVQWNA